MIYVERFLRLSDYFSDISKPNNNLPAFDGRDSFVTH